MIDQGVVHIGPAEMVVAAGGQHFERGRFVLLVPAHFQDRNVKRSPAEVEDHDLLFFAGFVQTIS